MTQILQNHRAKHKLREMRRLGEDAMRHLRKALVHVELAMKTQQDQLDKIGEVDAAVDSTNTINQGIVDDLDSQLDSQASTIVDLTASNDRTAEVEALDATLQKIKPVTSTHSPQATPTT